MISGTIPSTVTIPANLPSILLNFETLDDDVFEPNLDFMISIADANSPYKCYLYKSHKPN